MKTNVTDGFVIDCRKLSKSRVRIQYDNGAIKIINRSQISEIFKNSIVKGVLLSGEGDKEIVADKNLLPKEQILTLKKIARHSDALAVIIYYGELQNYYTIKNRKLFLQHIRPIKGEK